MDDFYDSAGAWLLWILMLPGVLPLIALAVLIFGFPARDESGVRGATASG